MLKKIECIHFVGIGGIGMSGIAEVLFNLGYKVTGSDIKSNEIIENLISKGIKIYIGHRKENVYGANVVVYSNAIPKDNIELITARENNIPTIPRAEMLAELMRLKYGIAIAGTHGKTTTTSMAGLVLSYGGLEPTIVVGGVVKTIKTNAKLGKGEFLVAEADESDASFLLLTPTITIVTNIDNDHLDNYGTMEKLKESFIQFMNKVPFYGCTIICNDDDNLFSISNKITKRVVTYGINRKSDFMADKIKLTPIGSTFQLISYGKKVGELELKVIGKHNVLNALSAVALGMELGIEFNKIKLGLKKFTGAQRRLEIIGKVKNILVIDDYAHHPTEIKTTISAAKLFKRRIIAIFQPHRYTRTKILYKEFGKAFDEVDEIFLTDIYPAGEKEIKGVTSELILNSIKQHKKGAKVYLINNVFDIPKVISKRVKDNDLILILGAGDIRKIGKLIISSLK
jgi:UDP-N-acetylmuramate--alanine ligase